MKTYDIHFNDNTNSNSKGFSMTEQESRSYIGANNGTNTSYFADYKGGTVSSYATNRGKPYTRRK